MIYNGYEIYTWQNSWDNEGKWHYSHDIWNCEVGPFDSECEAISEAIKDIDSGLKELEDSRKEYNEPSSEYLDTSWQDKTDNEF
jgi:hypothetical protein